jgi:hypothetical protein
MYFALGAPGIGGRRALIGALLYLVYEGDQLFAPLDELAYPDLGLADRLSIVTLASCS